ncbi:unnamed protein product [Bursaphelenchus xylophilus]|uniref:(pine wood nematode) hypothetical protein n=1 Tax=Bursaphelenchus xylophilus TaxID=6326 RepID=A0A1I7SQU5_BURXY|nr:unnamed protein product [Bursaphelenchus xylophilus]CAG9110400.1 unnamed protein product [Bursaphelenchus xylophilus]
MELVYLDWLNDIFGFILPCYVIYLSCFRTQNQQVKTYSKVIITNSILDIVYVVSNVMSMYSAALVGHQVVLVIQNPLADMYPLYGLLAYCFQIFIIFLCILFVPVQFIYRYRVVTSSDTSLKTVLLPLLLAASYMVVHCSFIPYTFQRTSPKYDKLLIDNGFAQYAGRNYYVGDVEANIWLIPHLGSCNLTVSLSYVLTYFYYKRTQRYLQRFSTEVTKSTLRAQKQMGRIMMLQALYPTVVFGLPCLILATSPIIGFSSKWLGSVMVIAVHTLPTLNALSVITCVPSYLQFIYRYHVVTSSDTSLKTVLLPLLLAASYMVVHCSFLPYTFQRTSPKYDKQLIENGFEEYAGRNYQVGDVEANIWLIPHLGSCNLTVLLSYVLVYFYYKRTQTYLRRFGTDVTKATLKAQKQMGRVLMLQDGGWTTNCMPNITQNIDRPCRDVVEKPDNPVTRQDESSRVK